MNIRFTKASGAGNDFVLLDNRKGELPSDHVALARLLCDRHFGIGGDGLLILEPSQKCTFLMKYYNADGSYGGMCGNGGRCIARFAFLRGLTGPVMTFEALDFVYQAEVLGDQVRLSMEDPAGLQLTLDIRPEGLGLNGLHFIDAGSPHSKPGTTSTLGTCSSGLLPPDHPQRSRHVGRPYLWHPGQ